MGPVTSSTGASAGVVLEGAGAAAVVADAPVFVWPAPQPARIAQHRQSQMTPNRQRRERPVVVTERILLHHDFDNLLDPQLARRNLIGSSAHQGRAERPIAVGQSGIAHLIRQDQSERVTIFQLFS
ncbi:MAG: hypothetical protein BWY79_01461 [Actinobacteria bacterium ADurb.Bin444]|nr:MAG: hypothetical protein BWY79_01461 [Actinobacteria bacterium ADurb.Bin444]